MPSLRILVAEDDSIVVLSLKGMLESLGHTVVGEAQDGVEAVGLARALRPDLIVMDIVMPRLDGLEAAAAITAKRPTPIILLTAHGEDELVQRAESVGVLAYLVKPVDEDNLGPAIRIALARFKELESLRQEVNTLKEALETRKLVERAKGILMDRLSLSEEEAHRRLQRQARDRNLRLGDLARSIIEASELL